MVYEMDRGLGSRMNAGNGGVGTKVSQIANIFQNNLIRDSGLDGKSKMSTSSSSLINRKDNEPTTEPIPIKSEGYTNRFNNARAVFEKLGTADEKVLSSSTPAPVVPSRFPVSKFKSSDSLNAFPSTATTTMATTADRKPTPFVINNSTAGSNGHSNIISQEIPLSTPMVNRAAQEENSNGDSGDEPRIQQVQL